MIFSVAYLLVRLLLGCLALLARRGASKDADEYIEHRQALSYLPGNEDAIASVHELRPADYRNFGNSHQVYDEIRQDSAGDVLHYRYIEVPLALGEAIMVNHALFGGLLLSRTGRFAGDVPEYRRRGFAGREDFSWSCAAYGRGS